jgi:hypothetical protein
VPEPELSLDTLKIIRGIDKRICPLICKSGERSEGERCIRIVCPAGQTLKDGTCVGKPDAEPKKRVNVEPEPRQRPAPAPAARPAAPAGGGGGKCFSFEGRRFCE